MRRYPPRGFTLVELLVVMAIIGVMVAMSIPAVLASREAGRRAQCQANLAQIMFAMQGHEDSLETFPSGVLNPDGPIRSQPQGQHISWIVQLLPYLDEQNVYQLIDLPAGAYAPRNSAARAMRLPVMLCPADPLSIDETIPASNYAGCHHDVEAPIDADNHGVLFLNSRIRRHDVSDGLSHTLFLSEKPAAFDDLGWMSGTRATLRNTGEQPSTTLSIKLAADPEADGVPLTAQPQFSNPAFVGSFGSSHPGGLMVGFGDCSVEFISDAIDAMVWQHLGHRADGSLTNIRER